MKIFLNKFKNTLLLNIIIIKSKKMIENNKDNFYAYSDKKNEKFYLIIQNKDANKNKINNEKNNYIITDEYSNSMINYIYELNDGRIVICCFDNQIKIISKNYAYDQFYIEQRLKDHNNLITSIIELSSGKLCSCSFDGTIKLWNKNDSNHYSQEKNLIIKTDSIFYTIIEVSKNNIVSLLRNFKENKKYLLIYSIENKNKILKNIDGIELYNKNLIKLDNEIFAFGAMNKIYVYNIKGETIKELDLDFSVVCLYKLNNNKFIISNNEGKLFLIDYFLTNDFNSKDSLNQLTYSENENMINKIISIEQFKDNTIVIRSKSKIYIFKMK
jgi:WD40 repeat protein